MNTALGAVTAENPLTVSEGRMLKIRLQGTTEDIEWFKRVMAEHPEIDLTEFSDLYTNKGTSRFFRVYAEVYRKIAQKRTV